MSRATRAGVLGLPFWLFLAALAPRQESPQARLVAFTNEPREPELGEVFALNLQVRLAPGVVAFFPDTLLAADDAVSAGSGSWTTGLAPADSVDVRATYPVMGLDNGGVELPSLELWTRAATGSEAGGPRSFASLDPASRPAVDPTGASTVAGYERVVIPVGGALIMPLRAMVEAADGGLVPQPPADVLGGNWSIWLVGAIVLLAAAVATLVWLLLTGRARAGRSILDVATLSPRSEALRELDRIRALDWHRNGRVVEFYDATTGVLRHFAERKERHWSQALTSTELLGRLAERWGQDHVSTLRDAVWSAERVKFGTHRPAPDAAEADWATVRGWITKLPDA